MESATPDAGPETVTGPEIASGHRTAHADSMIENRINAPQKSPAEGRQTVSKEFVQRVALIDASNFDAPALVCMSCIDS